MSEPILPCWKCGCIPTPDPAYYGWWVTCRNYDADWQGEEVGYVSTDPSVHGMTEAEAIENWNEQARENEATPRCFICKTKMVEEDGHACAECARDQHLQVGCKGPWKCDDCSAAFEDAMDAKAEIAREDS